MSNPPAEPNGTPPSGSLSSVATCCPQVTTFDGSRQPEKVVGFDARTNLAQTRDADEYWIPPDAAKSVPSDRMTQDGAAWVSVMIAGTTEVEVTFEGHSNSGCIANSTFEVEPAGIVEVSPNRGSASVMALALRGISEGEATVKVSCDGEDIGWFHVVCYREIILEVGIGCIKTELSRSVSYSTHSLSLLLNQTYNAAGITVVLDDLGEVDLSGDANILAEEHSLYSIVEASYYSDGVGDLQGQRALLGKPLDFVRGIFQYLGDTAASQTNAAYPRYLWFYVPDETPSRFNGMAVSIPSDHGFAFKDFRGADGGQTIQDSYAVLAHELGHTIGLHHPDADEIGSQLPSHLLASLGQPVEAEAATNIEPAIVPTPRALDPKNIGLIMRRDPLNLMGYWPNFIEQTFLRKNQWDAVRAVLSPNRP